MQANKAVRALGRSRKLGDRNRRGVGGEDGIALCDPIQRDIDFLLRVNILDDCFDNDVAVMTRTLERITRGNLALGIDDLRGY